MNNPKSIFTAPKALRRRSSDSSVNSASRPVLGAPELQSPLPQPEGQQLWHGRALPKPFPQDSRAETAQIAETAHRNSPHTPPAAGKKRSFDERDRFLPAAEQFPKRLRRNRKSGHKLEALDFKIPAVDRGTPPSPLFFSNTPQPRPALPPRFSSSEAAATMLSKTKGEDAGIKTVTLARGTPALGSPPPSRSKFSASLERRSMSEDTTPDTPQKSDALRVLSQVGITELLEQDERPTFIVDLQDSANYDTHSLKVIYANPSLRGKPTLLDSVRGRGEAATSEPFSSRPFSQFKAWVLSATVNGESLDVCLPSFITHSMSWSCATLRKRMRIVSGLQMSPSSSNSGPRSTPVSGSSRAPRPTHLNSAGYAVEDEPLEPLDYFGANAAEINNASNQAKERSEAVVQSVEIGSATEHHLTSAEPADSATDNTLVASSEAMRSSPGQPASNSGPKFDHTGKENGSALPDSLLEESVAVQHSIIPAEWSREDGFFDWTRLPNSEDLPSHIQFARGVDWGSTALGPIETWSADLRQMCNLIMASPHPAAMYWGEDLVAIYNEAYVLLAGQKHPTLMGLSYREAWREIWDEVKDVFANAQMTGQATMKDDDCLFIKRADYLEETYFSWSIIPIVGADGAVVGLYNPAFEKTRRKIAERRMLTLREVGERTATARDVKRFWGAVLDALECNQHDTPFVILYSMVGDEPESDDSSVHSSSMSASKYCSLEGALGVPRGHEAAPETIDLRDGTGPWVSIFHEVTRTSRPKVVDVNSGDIPAGILDGLEWRGFGDPAKSFVVCPIHPTTGETTLGFLVMGINPRRPYDDDYTLFVQLLSRQLATSLASVVLFEEEIKRGQRAAKLAAMDRIKLSEQLAARTEEAIESENKFSRMAEFAPVGMFIADSQGRINYCNDTWYEIARIPKETGSTDNWMDYVLPDDKRYVQELWRDLVEKAKPSSAEFRFKAPWMDQKGMSSDLWVLFSAYPERRANGSLKGVFGSITNISQQKWAEGFQKRKTEEAVELKRQQENFIDITSHEMRNPLSAILQCADEIVSSLSNARTGQDLPPVNGTLLDDNIDAAQTIALCAQHQKRIVDDVLTLSKLDSALLMVTPVDVQPLGVVQRALKMFESELQTADIQMEFDVDSSFRKLKVDWVRFDPSRVLQVLINLTTNAIKFTTTQSKRVIKVAIAASERRPGLNDMRPVDYFPSRSKGADMTEGPDWGDGEQLFIHFTVQDSGRGLTAEEKKLLFQRFSQASPRTHVQYGGSGLGLFISRELTELQGGEIGVHSESGKGSTFAFYVKARRSAPPQDSSAQFTASLAGRRSLESKAAVPDKSPVRNGQEALKILIVEDNLVNQRVLQKQLKNLGAVTHVANHGGEAIDMLRGSNFWAGHGNDALELSVVLMDQEMPVMDGLTCTKKIREMEEQGRLLSHVPIIAVTANARSEQIKTALEAGMDDVVAKPFKIPELMPKIEELVSKFAPPPLMKA